MKKTVCLLLATLVVFQLCNFIYAADSETTEFAPVSVERDSEVSNGGSGLIESTGKPEPGESNGGSESGGSNSGSSNKGTDNSGSSEDPSTGRGSGMAMDKMAAMWNWFNSFKENSPFSGLFGQKSL